MAEPDLLYHIMILYMLDKVEYPLTGTQITNFIIENDYTNYFVVQETIANLRESELVIAESTHNNTRYRLSDEGRETLGFFSDKISKEIRSEIDDYLNENNIKLKQETSVFADYMKSSGNGWLARCQIKNLDETILDLTLNVKTAEQAKAICANWKSENGEVYEALMDLLLK